MTKGIKNVDWTKQENNIKLLVAVLKHVDVSKSYDAIAKVFGDDVPGKTISARISKLKKEYDDVFPTKRDMEHAASMSKRGTNEPVKQDLSDKESVTDSAKLGLAGTPSEALVLPKNTDKVLSGGIKKGRPSDRKVISRGINKGRPSDRKMNANTRKALNTLLVEDDDESLSSAESVSSVEFGKAPKRKAKNETVADHDDAL